jgi:hypothetical protein
LAKSKIPPEFAEAGFEFLGVDAVGVEGHGVRKWVFSSG